MKKANIKVLEKKVDKYISSREFKKTDISRLIITVTQKMIGGNLEIQCGETATYADLLFTILCIGHSLAKDNKKIGSIDKFLDDLISMSQSEEFHKEV